MFNNKRRIFSIILTIVLVVGLLLGAVGQIVFADSNTKNITIATSTLMEVTLIAI